MQRKEVYELAARGFFQDQLIRGRVEETHISWVILNHRFAFKIKKPVRLSFLDFSNAVLRKKYCEREVKLNSRFTNIYQAVQPIRWWQGCWHIGGQQGHIKDYAVQMKRMAAAKRMDRVVEHHRARAEDMMRLGNCIADFHARAEKIYTPFLFVQAQNTFNDIHIIREIVLQKLGLAYAEIIDRAMSWSDGFLKAHEDCIQQRIDEGYQRDVHGDLHTHNIFLYKEPVIFDCIEFNDEYRQIDLLHELAFLCMDLESMQQPHLATWFFSAYCANLPCYRNTSDEALFTYYKCLKANVRAKVNGLRAAQSCQPKEIDLHVEEVRKYLALMQVYMHA